MYIGQVTLTENWQKLEDLIKAQVAGQSAFAFAAGKTYQLQGEGSYGVRLCNASTTPQALNDGERICQNQTALYEKEDGAFLYVKQIADTPQESARLKISQVGD